MGITGSLIFVLSSKFAVFINNFAVDLYGNFMLCIVINISCMAEPSLIFIGVKKLICGVAQVDGETVSVTYTNSSF